MSNEERNLRDQRLASRKKWFLIQVIVIAVMALLAVVSVYFQHKNSEAIYVEYNETSNVDYRVNLKENDFYEEETLGKDQAYIASLIDNIEADFEYSINMDATNVSYKYTYSVDAQLEIYDIEFKKPIYNPTEEIVAEKTYMQQSSDKLVIKETVTIDYAKFNQKALEFVKAYELSKVDCCIIVTMNIDITSTCEESENKANDAYVISLTIPLSNKTTEIEFVSSVPSNANKMLACNNAEATSKIFKIIAIISSSLVVVLGIVLAIYLAKTRDKNSEYFSKVSKITRSYRSYIQQINNEFNDDGYQVLNVNTIDELLEIRDTLQRPILFHENFDKTHAKFFILTDTKVLYLYEIFVDGYENHIK